ncbi:Crp/Fnr family transcriptional regulator [Psychrobacillus sp. NEAU-3TGS]|uniref:Crp/Fnr family transcriptional regulator n=1 Tax=Psychrobacillus sp. NEAU-3TGS TaxID=2995412 RepID=UPI002497AFCE|nr:Crp/Fnr family transcriptional regulator [Psychrobacillus sp. NEAU-3TGS]MDI2588756.1 Crp/Fnr family transcriptional regulator [Psychrobacillus sp. NEAU-3TGS]
MQIIQDKVLCTYYLNHKALKKVFTSEEHPFQIRRYRRNEVVLVEGEDIDGLYIQVSGRTKITTSVITGKALLLRFCSAISFMGEIELVQKVPIQSQVTAVEETDFIFITKTYIHNELMKDITFLQQLLAHTTYKLQTCTTASRINLLASVETRFASYLCTVRNGVSFGKEIQTTNSTEIASLIGTTTRHLNRVIEKLAFKKVIEKKKKEIIVIEWEKIEELSDGLRYE